MFRVTSYSDISGQVTASSVNADRITVACVFLPTGGLKTIRKQVPPSFPKWRNATDSHVERMVKVVLREAISISAGSVNKTTTEWQTFWENASDTHKKVASLERSSIGFLKGATLVKFIVFGNASASALGHAISTGMIHRPRFRKGRIEVEEEIVLDNEIHGDDNREALADVWRAINAHQPLSNSVGITRRAKTLQLASEQSEPLLLLADYVAGIVHVKWSQADVLQRSKVSPQAAAAGLVSLQQSGKFIDFSDAVRLRYFDIYPEFEHFSRRGAD